MIIEDSEWYWLLTPTDVVEQKKLNSFGFPVISYNGISEVKFGWDDTVDVRCIYEDVYFEDHKGILREFFPRDSVVVLKFTVL